MSIEPKDVPIVILAGGLGTRLMEETRSVPKPMVTVGELPILVHIMRQYAHFGFRRFVICLGYKGYLIKEYFLQYTQKTSDVVIDFLAEDDQHVQTLTPPVDWHVSLVETGEQSLTALRIYRAREYLKDYEVFGLTYGDGVSDVPIDEVYKFHTNHNFIGTVSAVHPPARFGMLELDNQDRVVAFKEKEKLNNDFINGGFFFFDNAFLDTLDGRNLMLEAEPLVSLAQRGELGCYKHDGFWQCMDTLRDREYLESLYSENKAPWVYQ